MQYPKNFLENQAKKLAKKAGGRANMQYPENYLENQELPPEPGKEACREGGRVGLSCSIRRTTSRTKAKKLAEKAGGWANMDTASQHTKDKVLAVIEAASVAVAVEAVEKAIVSVMWEAFKEARVEAHEESGYVSPHSTLHSTPFQSPQNTPSTNSPSPTPTQALRGIGEDLEATRNKLKAREAQFEEIK